MNDEQLELASAYLDGAVTDAERARVEADPALCDTVEALRAVRDALGEPGPPPVAARESAIAAGLAEFDRLSTGRSEPGADDEGASDTVATVLQPAARHRWRWSHLAGAAAAATVIVVGGVAILRDDAEAPTAVEAPDTDDVQPADAAPAEPEPDADALTAREATDGELEAGDAAPAPDPTVRSRPVAAPDDEEADDDEADAEPDDAAARAPEASPTAVPEVVAEADEAEPAVVPALGAPDELAEAEDAAAPAPSPPADLPRIESSVDLLDVVTQLVASPSALGEVRSDCTPGGGVDREPDVVIAPGVVGNADEIDAVIVRLASPSGDRYGAVDIATCALVVVSPSV